MDNKQYEYDSLFSLMENENQARDYYCSLPEYVKAQIYQRADNFNSFTSLKNYAENLMNDE